MYNLLSFRVPLFNLLQWLTAHTLGIVAHVIAGKPPSCIQKGDAAGGWFPI